MKVLAVILWVLAWSAISVSVVAVWVAIRHPEDDRAVAVVFPAVILGMALAWAGAAAW